MATFSLLTHVHFHVVIPDGSLDRKKLRGSNIFNDETKRKKLNSIVHPAVTRAILLSVLRCWIREERMCVVDVSLLIEGGSRGMDGLYCIGGTSAVSQLHRLMDRDKCTRDEARLWPELPVIVKQVRVQNEVIHTTTQNKARSVSRATCFP
ncbi:hypothetical protein EDC04DRAFT_2589376 [Pisolithus marmoratus]|nr:hypothetical protein EDC04DRAFT_2589376 [Pisolithus marmoratus]